MYVRTLFCAAVLAVALLSLASAQSPDWLVTMCTKSATNNFFLVVFNPDTGVAALEQNLGNLNPPSLNSFWTESQPVGLHLSVDGTLLMQIVGTWNGGTLYRRYQTTGSGVNLNQYTDSLVYNDQNVGLTSICSNRGDKKSEVLWTQEWDTGAYVSVSLLPIPQISTTTINRAANDRSYRGEPLVGNIASNPRSPLTLDTYYIAPTYGSGNKGLYYGEADVAAGTYTLYSPFSVPADTPDPVAVPDAFDLQEFSNDGSTVYSLAVDPTLGTPRLVVALDYDSATFNAPLNGTFIRTPTNTPYYFCTGLTTARNRCSRAAPFNTGSGK